MHTIVDSLLGSDYKELYTLKEGSMLLVQTFTLS